MIYFYDTNNPGCPDQPMRGFIDGDKLLLGYTPESAVSTYDFTTYGQLAKDLKEEWGSTVHRIVDLKTDKQVYIYEMQF